jgi:hypothetical protein
MDAETLALGTETSTWAIKDFSVVLRQQITQAARRHDCTVADWLHGHFQRHGIDGLQIDPVKLNQVEPVSSANGVDELCRLTEAAARLAETRDRMPRSLSGAVSKRLRDALRTGAPTRSRPRLIAAPEAT